ncbi:hypothetical protein [Amaricoccus sp.]|uniref:hypothetical protein n=1 Tax=Amaricoccus sp. TaxID=1872485 RepID=UPI001B682D81|nr:hypothetical protein [Amaricoccus sp.]MBP7241552.1 hypothetical protein [Amaricoccus sp.]
MVLRYLTRRNAIAIAPHVLAFVCALLVFLWGFDHVIESKSWIEKTWEAARRGFVGGLVGGTFLGGFTTYVIGGIGLAAMGTAVGLGGWIMICAGAGFGAIFGSMLGSGLGFFDWWQNPGAYSINFGRLPILILVSLIFYGTVFYATRTALSRITRLEPPA